MRKALPLKKCSVILSIKTYEHPLFDAQLDLDDIYRWKIHFNFYCRHRKMQNQFNELILLPEETCCVF
jgi:hypothetical protein